ncbi:hypothetical protein VOLCADRAFT_105196 [Volvox carteri f. nagariensis]|uniref:Uncharacterized protein n=1 Tax=Volvox carteri f. nagariensis TaxID=3068 RepID=D8TZ77_VOLCA|nr:uncharacterized protein VOLCADRAFT_105196 [Volvox carteri f. nagariensis]EFJ47228.1 hypothetical protein VOLCADRAFT_105196 [Volvox carteri f. nagariensis]|eukprot:XP_002951777.1 hypothetical protein VOLCADRAFT_105196 [Volvox carteri f. nagariensis]
MDAAASQTATLLVQNLMILCQQLRLPISYKVHEWPSEAVVEPAANGGGNGSGGGGGSTADGGVVDGVVKEAGGPASRQRRFSMVVHVHGDHAFKKYLQNFSSSDLPLYRGLLLQVETNEDLSRLVAARVQQAFLPKFENEGQDTSVADRVVAAAAEGRPTIITVKHSGSLVTLSYDGGGAALLRAHYERRHPNDPTAATAALERLFAAMASKKLCLSFEMVIVTGCHGHHGQLPAAEYLVTTAAHTLDPVTGAPAFLDWLPFLELCTEYGLPTNDTWVVAGGSRAAAVRQALDSLALRGGPTGHAMRVLDELVSEEVEGAGDGGCLRLPGTYPHDGWQGTRLEGFVVAAGQPLGAQEMSRLRAIRDVLEGARLPLEAAAAAWMPQAALPYVSPGDGESKRVKELLMSQIPEGLQDGKPYMELSYSGGGGNRRVYSRLALQQLDTQGLQGLLAGELAEEELAAAAMGGGSCPSRAQALREVATDAATATDTGRLLVRAMRALSGRPETATTTLRYKKKMIMWTFPPDDGDGDGDAAAANGGVVGYSLMTFVIRNGLPALRQGASNYAAYVDNLVRRSWGLPASQVAQVQHFARCWAAWVAARGGAAAVEEYRYLDVAEPFVQEFLKRRGAMALSGRPETAFQGVLICVDTSEAFTTALRRAVAPSLEIKPAKLGDTGFSKGMVPGGVMIWLQPGSELPKKLRDFLAAGAAPFTWLVTAAPPRETTGPDNEQAAKRQKGLAQAKIGAITAALGADGGARRVRQVTLPAPEDDIDGAVSAQLAAEVTGWLGVGSPLPPADPAVAAYFVTIPGAGKSVLTKGVMTLPVAAAADGSQQQQQVTVKVLNSDTLKKTVKNFNPNRYWFEVAAAADSCVGGGHVTVSVADKNLVPSPPGNINRALEPLKGTGVASLAIVPVVAGPSTLSAPAPGYGDLYGGLPDLPFPLELVALCMLRTLKRRNHEGGLDGEKAPSAATVVAMFAGFYRHKRLPELLEALRNLFTRVVELPIMRGDGIAAGAAVAGGGAAATGEVGGGGSVPVEVLRHVATGVRNVSEREKPQLPAEWEARARELLLRPDVEAALEALQLPMEDVRRHLEAEISATLEQVRATASADEGALTSSLTLPVGGLDIGDGSAANAAAAAAAEERVSYFAVSGLDDETVRAAAGQVLAPELHAKLRRGALHVTLWHRADSEQGFRTDVRQSLMGLVGSPVQLEVTDVDISPQVVAAHVRLVDADEAIPPKAYHHITLLVEKGHTAVEANKLPARLAAGEPGVERKPLPGGPLLLTGVVTAVEVEALPL